MILATRMARPRDGIRGLQFLSLADWAAAPLELAQAVFLAFDVAMRKLQTDPDATRIRVPGEDDTAMSLNTAREAAIRAVPERYASQARLYSLFFEASGRRLRSDFPEWLHVAVETREGTLDSIRRAEPSSSWWTTELTDHDDFVHVAPLRAIEDLSPARIEGLRVFRMALLIEESLRSKRSPFRIEIPLWQSGSREASP